MPLPQRQEPIKAAKGTLRSEPAGAQRGEPRSREAQGLGGVVGVGSVPTVQGLFES